MNRKSTFIISLTAVVIFSATVLFFTIKTGTEASRGKKNAKDQFSFLVQNTFDLLETNSGINDLFIEEYTGSLRQYENIGAVIIRDENHVYFAHPLNSKLLFKDSAEQYSIKTNSSIVSVYSSTIPFSGSTAITITAALYHITPSQIYSSARAAFMIILITTLGIFFIIILQSLLYKKNSAVSDVQNTPDAADNSVKKQIQDPAEDSDLLHTVDTENKTVIIKDTENMTNEESLTASSILGERVSDPLGLFSKETGFGWESYLETRLDSELARAASSEQDLALFVIRIKDLPRNLPHTKKIATILLDNCRFRDLIFEYGSDGYACIIQEIDLDRSMKLAEKIYNALLSLLQEINIPNPVGIGISTRTLRIIPGSRILHESSQACSKAFEEDGLPIVAFRVNPDKYRKFLTEVEE